VVDATNDASRNVGSNRGETDQRRLVRSQLSEAGADVLRPTHGICPLNDAHRNKSTCRTKDIAFLRRRDLASWPNRLQSAC
jgi:hypothetical protein